MKVIFFTGSGISKESGLDTFRGDDGTWESYDVKDVAHANAWRYGNKARIIEFHNLLRKKVLAAAPNAAHAAIAELSKTDDVWVITQNIDDLHERAGVPYDRVIHLHGEILYATDGISRYEIREDMPIPEGRKSDRPDIVWFGEQPKMVDVAEELIGSADVIIIVGTSLGVWPAAGLVLEVHHKSKIVVDPGVPEPLSDMQNTVHIQKEATAGVIEAIETIKAFATPGKT